MDRLRGCQIRFDNPPFVIFRVFRGLNCTSGSLPPRFDKLKIEIVWFELCGPLCNTPKAPSS